MGRKQRLHRAYGSSARALAGSAAGKTGALPDLERGSSRAHRAMRVVWRQVELFLARSALSALRSDLLVVAHIRCEWPQSPPCFCSTRGGCWVLLSGDDRRAL